MSAQQPLPGFEGRGPENRVGVEAVRASIAREMRYLLSISRDASKPFAIRPAGVAHSLGVCLIEDYNMARGKRRDGDDGKAGSMPTFVDIRMDQDARKRFLDWYDREIDAVKILTDLADTGYRVGCAWSGDAQAYTISLTCRTDEQPNNGLCMTSFARDLHQCVCLAWFKHSHLAKGAWRTYAPESTEGWG